MEAGLRDQLQQSAEIRKGNRVMIRLFQRVSVPLLFGVVFTLIPLSSWGQSTAPDSQDRTNQSDVNQTNQTNQTNQNVDRTQDQNQYKNRSGQSNRQSNTGRTDTDRQKTPDTSNPNAIQNQQNTNTQQNTTKGTQRRNRAANRKNRTTNPNATQSGSDVNQKNQSNNANQSEDPNRTLPRTAGEMPLLALIGFASLIGAFAVRTFAKSTR
jgi:hypothetical protein